MVSNRGRRRSRPETIEETPIKRPPAHGVWIVAVTAMVLGLSAFGFFDRFENLSIDFRFALRGLRPADPRMVLLAIDEKSIKGLGLFSWPREIHARLIDRLTQAGAAVAAARRKSPESVLRQLPGTTFGWNPLINFTGWEKQRGGSPSPFHYSSYADALPGRLDPGVFKDKIVLVGETAAGLFDALAVPNLRIFPGLEIHANIVDNLLNRSFLWSPPRRGTWGIVILFQMALGTRLAGLTTPRGTAIVLGGVVGYYFLAQGVFNRRSLALDVIAPIATTLANHSALLFRRLLMYEREIA